MKIGARVIVYNQIMRQRRNELGWTQKELGEMVGLHTGVIGEIELLKAPQARVSTIRAKLNNIAEVLEIPFHELFPQDYLNALTKKLLPKKSSFEWEGEVSLETLDSGTKRAIALLEAPDLDLVIDRELLRKQLEESFDCLNDYERKILELRYGFTNRGELTLRGVSEALTEMGYIITKERVRQIESRALRKLRNASHFEKLQQFRINL